MAGHAPEEQVRGQCDAWMGGKLAVETQTITVLQPRDASVNCLIASRNSPLSEAIPMSIREGGRGSPAQTPAVSSTGPPKQNFRSSFKAQVRVTVNETSGIKKYKEWPEWTQICLPVWKAKRGEERGGILDGLKGGRDTEEARTPPAHSTRDTHR